MEIRPVANMSFKNITSDDLYRLEQKIDSLQASMNGNDLNSFYRDLPKTNRMPMPLGVPPYAMGGMGMPMPPMGPMGMPPIGPMSRPGMMPMPGCIGMPPMGGMYAPPMGMPPLQPNNPTCPRLSGQPCTDIFCQHK